MKITINIAAFVLGLVAANILPASCLVRSTRPNDDTEAFILLAGGFIAGLLIVLVAWGCVELYYYNQRTP